MNRILKPGVVVAVLLLFVGLALIAAYSYSSVSKLIAINDQLRADLSQVEMLAEDAMDTADEAYETIDDLSTETLNFIENYRDKVSAEDVVWLWDDEEVTLLEYVINEDGRWQIGAEDVVWLEDDEEVTLLEYVANEDGRWQIGAEDVVWLEDDEEVTLLEYVANEDGRWRIGITDVWLSCNDEDINLLDALNTASFTPSGIRCPAKTGLGE